MDYLKATGQSRAGFLEEPPDSAVAHLGHAPGESGPSNGITTITRHRLQG